MATGDRGGSSRGLIGDAAGYIEPFTGEGMAWALHSAELLAEVVSEAVIGRWDAACARQYQIRWRSEVERRQLTCRLLAAALERGVMRRAGIIAGELWPALAQRVARQVVVA